MGITRRGFLKAMLGAAAAPAIVRAASLMPIYVPKQEILTPQPVVFGLDGDFTVEAWIKPVEQTTVLETLQDTVGVWRHVAQTRCGDQVIDYIDGVVQLPGTLAREFPAFRVEKIPPANGYSSFVFGKKGNEYFTGHMDDLRLTEGLVRDIEVPEPPKPAHDWLKVSIHRPSNDLKIFGLNDLPPGARA